MNEPPVTKLNEPERRVQEADKTQTVSSLKDEAAEVMAANQAFYDAIESRDFETMSQLWEPSVRATCVHPGRPILRGWNAVANSWLEILQGPGRNQFILTNASITVEGDLAWVVLDEDLVTATMQDPMTDTIAATNIFARHDDAWLMVMHHGSAVLSAA